MSFFSESMRSVAGVLPPSVPRLSSMFFMLDDIFCFLLFGLRESLQIVRLILPSSTVRRLGGFGFGFGGRS